MQQQKFHVHQVSCHWTFRKQAVSSPVLRPLKSDTQLILQHFKLQEWYRDQKLQVFFSIEIVLFQNGTRGSIEYIHVNWPCHQPTFAGEALMNIHHRKLLRMSWHMSLLLPMLNLIPKRATLELLIHSRASSSKFFFQSIPLLVVSIFIESEPTFSQVNLSVCWKLEVPL